MVDFTFLIGKFSCKIMTTMYRNSNGSSQSSCDIKISNVRTEDTVQIGTSIVFWEYISDTMNISHSVPCT